MAATSMPDGFQALTPLGGAAYKLSLRVVVASIADK
jgi:hypothetical protein